MQRYSSVHALFLQIIYVHYNIFRFFYFFPDFFLQLHIQQEQINDKINESHERDTLAVLTQVYRGSKHYFRANSEGPGKSRQDRFLTNISFIITHKLQ
jgi:hypothetical protein